MSDRKKNLKPIIPSDETSNLRVAPQALDLMRAESAQQSQAVTDDLKLPDLKLPISDMPEVELVDNSRVVRGCCITGLILLLGLFIVLVPVVYPLSSALKNRHFTYARVLMALGADVNKRDDSGRTYLYKALMDKNHRLVRFLLECKDTDTSEWTPLSLAVLLDDEVEVKLLLQDGADVKQEDSFGKIPLQWAIEMECNDCINVLLEHHKESFCKAPYNCLSLLNIAKDNAFVADRVRAMASQRLYELQKGDGGISSFSDAYSKGAAEYMILYAAENEWNADDRISLLELKALADDTHGLQQMFKENGYDIYMRETLPSAVYWAAAAGNTNSLNMLLQKAKEENVELDYRLCPLSEAVRCGYKEVVELLLQSPCIDKRRTDAKGRNVIFVAVEQGNAEMLETLIHSECNDLNAIDKDAVTPLHLAKKIGNAECVRLLEEAGYKEQLSSLQAKMLLREKGITVNSLITEPGSIDEMEFHLMELARFDLNTKYASGGYTPLTYNITEGNTHLVELLLKAAAVDVNLKDRQGNTPLICAVKSNRKDMVKRLLQCKKINVRELNADSVSALDIAVKQNSEDIVTMLLEVKGVDLNSTDSSGKSKLEHAFDHGNLSIAEKLIAAGEQINYSLSQRDGYIHQYVGKEEVIRFLLKNGLGVNSVDKDGNSLLHLAVAQNSVPTLKVLANTSGVELNKKNSHGKTPLLLAVQNNKKAAVEYLLTLPGIDVLAMDSKGASVLQYAVQKDDATLLTKLLDVVTAEADVSRADAAGNTLLHEAVNARSKKCLELLLLISGINVNAGNNEGVTPLMLAAEYNQGDMLELLLKTKGIELNVQDAAGRTALYYAATDGHAEIIEALLKVDGINCDLADLQGYSPRSIAQQKKHYECVKLFRSYIDEIPDNYESKIDTYRKEAEQNKSSAQFLLALCHYEGKGTSQNYAEAAKWFKKAAERQHSYAQYYMGLCCQNGYGVKKNEKEAANWFEKAAEQEHTLAQYMIAMAYYRGKGKEKNPAKAVRWFRTAAEAGCEESQFRLGVCYNSGEGVDRSAGDALFWFKKAAYQGHVKAQYNVGCYYYERREYDEAIVWFDKAAESYMPEAIFNLGDCYYNGYGNIETDLKKAFEFYRAAAELNYAPAQFNVACCYYEGIGVTKNENTAMQWFKKAAKNGHKGAKEFLEN